MYLYSRNMVVRIIRRSKKTKDGFYWCPFVRSLLMLDGSVDDSDYTFDRKIFEYCLYFSEFDIKLFLEKTQIKLDVYEYYGKHERFYNLNKDLINFDVCDLVKEQKYTVGELIDVYEFRY